MLSLMKEDLEMPDEEVTPDYLLETLCIIGDVKECTEQLEGVLDATGGFGTLLMMAHDWDDRSIWNRSMDLLVHDVLPKLPSLPK